MVESSQAPAVLAYADLPARHGIQYESGPDELTIAIPQGRWWARREAVAAMIVLALVTTLLISTSLLTRSLRPLIIQGGVMLAVIVVSVVSMSRQKPVTLRVTRKYLRMEHVRPLYPSRAVLEKRLSYPVSEVHDLHFVPHSGNIVVRVYGEEMIEFQPSPSPEVNLWVADELRRALGLSA